MHVLCIKPDVDLEINAHCDSPRFQAPQPICWVLVLCAFLAKRFTPISRKNKETMILAPRISSLSVQMHPMQNETVLLRLMTVKENTQQRRGQTLRCQ